MISTNSKKFMFVERSEMALPRIGILLRSFNIFVENKKTIRYQLKLFLYVLKLIQNSPSFRKQMWTKILIIYRNIHQTCGGAMKSTCMLLPCNMTDKNIRVSQSQVSRKYDFHFEIRSLLQTIHFCL